MIASSRRSLNSSGIVTVLVVIGVAAGAGIAIGFGGFTWVALLGAGLVGTAVLFRRPAFGAALIMALAPLEGAVTIGGDSILKLVTLGCVGMLFVRVVVLHKGIVTDRTTWWALIFVGWVFITVIWTPDQEDSFSNLVSLILQSMLYVVLLNLITSLQDLKLALWGHILGGTILGLLLIQTLVTSEFDRRLQIGGLGLNLAARMVGLNLLLSMLLSQLETHRLAKLILRVSVILSGVAVVVSLSRGAWYGVVLSLAAGVAVFALRGKNVLNLRQLLMWVTVGSIGFYLLGSVVFTQHGLVKLAARFQSSFTFSDSASHRFEIWDVGLAIFLDSPVVGHGFGSFSREFTRFLANAGLPDSFNAGDGKQPHNAFVLVIAEFGSVGLFLVLAILGSVLGKLWRLLRHPQAHTPTLAWGAILMIYLISTSLVDTAIERKYFWYILCLITLLVRYWGNNVQSINLRESLPSLLEADAEERLQPLQRRSGSSRP